MYKLRILKTVYFSKNVVFLMFISAFFLTVTVKSLKYETLHADEPNLARFPIQVLAGPQPDMEVDTEAWILNTIPTNYHEAYAFHFISFLLLPTFLLFGINIFALKLTGVLAGLFLILISHAIVKEKFGYNTAIATTLLLSSSANYMAFAKSSVQAMEFFIALFIASSCWMILIYSKTQRSRYLYLASLFAGLSFSIKLSAAAMFLALGVGVFTAYRKEFIAKLKQIRKFQIFIALIMFLLGSSLFLAYNISTRGKTLNLIKYFSGQYRLVENPDHADYLDNMKMRNVQFKNMFSAMPRKRVWSSTFYYLFLLSLVFNIYFVLKRKDPVLIKRLLFVDIVYAVIYAISGMSPGSISPLQLSLLYPFPYVSVAILLNFIREDLKLRARKYIYISVLLALVLINCVTIEFYHYRLKRTIGPAATYNSLLEYIEKEDTDMCIIAREDLANSFKLSLLRKGISIKEVRYEQEIHENLDDIEIAEQKIFFIQGGKEVRYMHCHVPWFEEYIVSNPDKLTKTADFHDKKGKLRYSVYLLNL